MFVCIRKNAGEQIQRTEGILAGRMAVQRACLPLTVHRMRPLRKALPHYISIIDKIRKADRALRHLPYRIGAAITKNMILTG